MSKVRARSIENRPLERSVADTLPQLLRRNAAIMAHRPAIREKTLGIWRTFSWAEYERQVREFALGLAAYGFLRGDKLAVIGDNRPRLYGAQLAAQCLGGIAVPTLLVWGASDQVVTPDYGRIYSRLIPGSQFAVIERAGHHPEIEQPAAFVERVAAFLEE